MLGPAGPGILKDVVGIAGYKLVHPGVEFGEEVFFRAGQGHRHRFEIGPASGAELLLQLIVFPACRTKHNSLPFVPKMLYEITAALFVVQVNCKR